MDEIIRLMALACLTSTATLFVAFILYTVSKRVFCSGEESCRTKEMVRQPTHERAVREAILLAKFHLGQAKIAEQ